MRSYISMIFSYMLPHFIFLELRNICFQGIVVRTAT